MIKTNCSNQCLFLNDDLHKVSILHRRMSSIKRIYPHSSTDNSFPFNLLCFGYSVLHAVTGSANSILVKRDKIFFWSNSYKAAGNWSFNHVVNICSTTIWTLCISFLKFYKAIFIPSWPNTLWLIYGSFHLHQKE
jgi:hypothetical protein